MQAHPLFTEVLSAKFLLLTLILGTAMGITINVLSHKIINSRKPARWQECFFLYLLFAFQLGFCTWVFTYDERSERELLSWLFVPCVLYVGYAALARTWDTKSLLGTSCLILLMQFATCAAQAAVYYKSKGSFSAGEGIFIFNGMLGFAEFFLITAYAQMESPGDA